MQNLTYFEASLALFSTLIGAGIVGVPFAFYYLGISFALLMNAYFVLSTSCVCMLLLKAKDLTGGLESFTEIGYRLFKSFFIYYYNILTAILCIGLNTAYFNIFAGICVSLHKDIYNDI